MVSCAVIITGIILFNTVNINKIKVKCTYEDKLPDITPDYKNITIPFNIAPLNFIINNKAKKFVVTISSTKSKPKVIKKGKPGITLTRKKWKKL